MLVEIGIGDGYGRAFEFNTPEFIKEKNNGIQYHLRDGEDPELFGKYTDDTQMSLGVALAIWNNPNSIDIIAKYWSALNSADPHDGYSTRVRTALAQTSHNTTGAKEFLTLFKLDNVVDSNGTMMRSVPIGVLPTEAEVLRYAQIQSTLTHSSFDASVASQIIALLSHYFYHRKHKDSSLASFISYASKFGLSSSIVNSIIRFDSMMENDKMVKCDALGTTGAVLSILFRTTSMTELLKQSIALTGDVDSVAAVSLGLASLTDFHINDLDKRLYKHLENGKHGKDFLLITEKQLFKKFPRPKK